MNLLQCERHTQENQYRVEYVLERPFARIEFQNRASLIQFLQESLLRGLTLGDQASTTEIAAFAARSRWTLIEFDGSEPHVGELLQSALNTIHRLLGTTELNMDDLEEETLREIQKAADFENLAARIGFSQNCFLVTTGNHHNESEQSCHDLTISPVLSN